MSENDEYTPLTTDELREMVCAAAIELGDHPPAFFLIGDKATIVAEVNGMAEDPIEQAVASYHRGVETGLEDEIGNLLTVSWVSMARMTAVALDAANLDAAGRAELVRETLAHVRAGEELTETDSVKLIHQRVLTIATLAADGGRTFVSYEAIMDGDKNITDLVDSRAELEDNPAFSEAASADAGATGGSGFSMLRSIFEGWRTGNEMKRFRDLPEDMFHTDNGDDE